MFPEARKTLHVSLKCHSVIPPLKKGGRGDLLRPYEACKPNPAISASLSIAGE